MDRELPHGGEERLRIRRIHDDVDSPGVLVDEEHTVPLLAAVSRAEHTTFGLRPIAVTERGDEDDVRIPGIDYDAGDASGIVEAHASPRLPGIGGLVDAVADRDVPSDEHFAGPHPHDIWIGWSNRDGADRRNVLLVEERLPVQTGIGRLEQAP